MKNKVQIKEIRFKKPIFRFLIDTEKGLLLVESRDGDYFETTFTLIEIETGHLILEDYQTIENWWLGIAAFKNEKIIFYTYTDTEKPLKEGIFVLDCRTKTVLWQKPQYTFFDFLKDDQIIVYEMTEAGLLYAVLEFGTGRVIQDQFSTIPKNYQPSKDDSLLYPIHYNPENPHYNTFQAYFKKKKEIEIRGEIEYLEWRNCIYIHYTDINEKSIFLGIGSEGEEIFSIPSGSGQVAETSFMIADERIIYLKESDCIVVIRYI